MELVTLGDAPAYDADKVVAAQWLGAPQCNVRIIRLSAGQELPPHRHGASDLMLYVLEGAGTIAGADGAIPFAAGTLAHLSGDEELRVANVGTVGMTLLAFLAPPFPPA